jgi:hypothetical protein
LGNIFKMILKVARWSKLPTFTVDIGKKISFYFLQNV